MQFVFKGTLDTLKEVAHFRVVVSEENYWVEDYWKATIKLLQPMDCFYSLHNLVIYTYK